MAILDSFLRPYWIGGRRELVRETCDWFCLPEYRTLGIGLHLMRRMMAKPEPILVVGGTEYTQNLLPRLKWARLANVGRFILVISPRTIAGLLTHKRWRYGSKLARAIPDIPLIRRLPCLASPSTDSEVRARVLGEVAEVHRIAAYVIAPALDTQLLDWLACAPAVLGQFLLLNFVCNRELVGISISRLEKFSFGCMARMMHLHATRFEVMDWMVAATARRLVEQGAGVILCDASCTTTAGALSKLGFWRRKPTPAYWWPNIKLPQHGLLHLTSLRADDALQIS